MAQRYCPDDGYPIQETRFFGGSHEDCPNPWHPEHPGACPECGSEGFHRLAHVGEPKTAKCARCGRHWVPEVSDGGDL